jgi:hypothetical protein
VCISNFQLNIISSNNTEAWKVANILPIKWRNKKKINWSFVGEKKVLLVPYFSHLLTKPYFITFLLLSLS